MVVHQLAIHHNWKLLLGIMVLLEVHRQRHMYVQLDTFVLKVVEILIAHRLLHGLQVH